MLFCIEVKGSRVEQKYTASLSACRNRNIPGIGSKYHTKLRHQHPNVAWKLVLEKIVELREAHGCDSRETVPFAIPWMLRQNTNANRRITVITNSQLPYYMFITVCWEASTLKKLRRSIVFLRLFGTQQIEPPALRARESSRCPVKAILP